MGKRGGQMYARALWKLTTRQHSLMIWWRSSTFVPPKVRIQQTVARPNSKMAPPPPYNTPSSPNNHYPVVFSSTTNTCSNTPSYIKHHTRRQCARQTHIIIIIIGAAQNVRDDETTLQQPPSLLGALKSGQTFQSSSVNERWRIEAERASHRWNVCPAWGRRRRREKES